MMHVKVSMVWEVSHARINPGVHPHIMSIVHSEELRSVEQSRCEKNSHQAFKP